MTDQRLAIWLMIGQGILFAAETMVIHSLGAAVPIMEIALLRGIGGLAVALVFARRLGFDVVRTRQLRLQLARAALSLFHLWIMVYTFRALPLTDATAISYTQAAYIAVFSVIVLQERVTASRWAAAGIGIGGALLIAKPTFAECNPVYLIALAGATINGLAFVLNRYLQREDSEATTMFYTNLVLLVGNLPAFLLSTPAFVALSITPSVALLLLGPVGMYFGIVAARHANIATLGPYTLIRLVVVMLAGAAVFQEFPDPFAALGLLLIVLACAVSSVPGSRYGTRLEIGPFRFRLAMGHPYELPQRKNECLTRAAERLRRRLLEDRAARSAHVLLRNHR
jgi:drug/metabolite transporter (DMT)-like permease